ncbi:MAG: PPE domain-containing protein [Pseudonocardiaceae bacterium]
MGTSIDYGTVSHEAIYSCITGGPGSAELADASQDWQSVSAKLLELQDLVDQAVRGIGATQQGVAADAATDATMALTLWISDGVAAANGIAARVAEQAGAFAYTRDNMPPSLTVPEVSFSQDPEAWMADHSLEWLPGIQTEHERALVAAQQAEQRARELMSAYQDITNENLTVNQQFTGAPTVVAEVVEPVSGSGSGLGGWSAQPGPLHPGAVRPDLTYAGGYGAGTPAATAQQLISAVHQAMPLADQAMPVVDQAMSTVDQAMPPALTSPQFAGDYPSQVDQPVARMGSVQPSAAAPFGPSPILAGSAAPGGDRVRNGSRFSGDGSARRGGGFGPRPSVTFSAGDSRLGGSSGPGNPGLGGSGQGSLGMGNPAQSSAEPADTGRATRGGAGWAAAPLGTTGGAGPAGSFEHRRPSYLIEQDTSAIVGELPRVAPPVIGADEDYR